MSYFFRKNFGIAAKSLFVPGTRRLPQAVPQRDQRHAAPQLDQRHTFPLANQRRSREVESNEGAITSIYVGFGFINAGIHETRDTTR